MAPPKRSDSRPPIREKVTEVERVIEELDQVDCDSGTCRRVAEVVVGTLRRLDLAKAGGVE